jgi:predicted unusual protein kinase regulating ubiquinone biosynthesis (AarF/ABC1/UbiB family)
VSRLLQFGRLAGGIAGGALSEGARQIASGRRPAATDLLLTPANAGRLADRLAELRGAAMKVGQLLSMEAGDFLPPELTQILARLRDDGHSMPLGQVAEVLNSAWGKDWSSRFRRFSFTPLAAASIGQVHEAETTGGDHLAVKIQYPGVRDSIDSDVANVATLVKLFRLAPEGLELQPLLDEARRQLHHEADYLREARLLTEYAERLEDDDGFIVPRTLPELTTRDVLAMSFLAGERIETVVDAPRATRDRVASRLLGLALREFFDWGLVQTDPNFANFRYDPASERIGLLDFGATRPYAAGWVEAFRRLFSAAVRQDAEEVRAAAVEAGYLSGNDDADYQEAIAGMILTAAEPARSATPFDFAGSSLSRRIQEQVMRLRLEQRIWRMPSPDILFLHRKLGGMYLLCARLRARVDVAAIAAPYVDTC